MLWEVESIKYYPDLIYADIYLILSVWRPLWRRAAVVRLAGPFPPLTLSSTSRVSLNFLPPLKNVSYHSNKFTCLCWFPVFNLLQCSKLLPCLPSWRWRGDWNWDWGLVEAFQQQDFAEHVYPEFPCHCLAPVGVPVHLVAGRLASPHWSMTGRVCSYFSYLVSKWSFLSFFHCFHKRNQQGVGFIITGDSRINQTCRGASWEPVIVCV